MLAGDQIHYGEAVGGRHVPHPVGLARVGAVQVIEVVILKNLQRTGRRVRFLSDMFIGLGFIYKRPVSTLIFPYVTCLVPSTWMGQ